MNKICTLVALAVAMGGCASKTYQLSLAETVSELQRLYPPHENAAPPGYDQVTYKSLEDTVTVTILEGSELQYDRTEISAAATEPSRTKVSVQVFQDGPWMPFPQRDFTRERTVLNEIDLGLGPLQANPRLMPASTPAKTGNPDPETLD